MTLRQTLIERVASGSSIANKLRLVAFLGILAALQLAINPNLFVNPSTNLLIDPWIYTGFFLTLPAHVRLFPNTYYGSRLSVIVPGFLAHHLFPPLIANYVLHIGLFCALLVTTYALVRRGANVGLGLLAATVMAWNPTILSALSWDYVDGAGIVFFMGALLCVEAAATAERGGRGWATGAGILAACLVTTNIFLIVIVPVLSLFLLLRARSSGPTPTRRLHRVAAVLGFAALGATATLAVLSLVSVGVGGSWTFLEPQWREARKLMTSRNPWQLPGYSWVPYATWLVLPGVATAGALIECVSWVRWRRPLTFELAIQLTFLAVVGLWVIIQVLSTPVLQISYYSSYLAPLAVLALALQLGSMGLNDTRRALRLTLTAVAIFAAGAWLILTDAERFWTVVQPAWFAGALASLPQIGREHAQACAETTLGLGAGLVGVLAARVSGPLELRVTVFALMLAISYGAVPQFWPAARGPSGRTWFDETAVAHRFIAEQNGGRKLRLWYRLTPGSTRPFKSISSTYLWGYVLVNEEMPALSEKQARTLDTATRLVLLAANPREAEGARDSLRRIGLDYQVVAQRDFGSGDTAFLVVVGDMARRGSVSVQ